MASLVPQEVAHPGLQGLTSLVGGVASGCQGQRHRCYANPKYCSIIIIAVIIKVMKMTWKFYNFKK